MLDLPGVDWDGRETDRCYQTYLPCYKYIHIYIYEYSIYKVSGKLHVHKWRCGAVNPGSPSVKGQSQKICCFDFLVLVLTVPGRYFRI